MKEYCRFAAAPPIHPAAGCPNCCLLLLLLLPPCCAAPTTSVDYIITLNDMLDCGGPRDFMEVNTRRQASLHPLPLHNLKNAALETKEVVITGWRARA